MNFYVYTWISWIESTSSWKSVQLYGTSYGYTQLQNQVLTKPGMLLYEHMNRPETFNCGYKTCSITIVIQYLGVLWKSSLQFLINFHFLWLWLRNCVTAWITSTHSMSNFTKMQMYTRACVAHNHVFKCMLASICLQVIYILFPWKQTCRNFRHFNPVAPILARMHLLPRVNCLLLCHLCQNRFYNKKCMFYT